MLTHSSSENMPTISKRKTPTSQNEYVLTFPPRTAMGLELEPVILSTNPPRQIGCRVKDFYFGTDFIEGLNIPNTKFLWNREFLMERVKIGDVICKVDDERVVSKSFVEILAMLRNLRNTDRSRLITFRNISSHVPAREQLRIKTASSPSFFLNRCLDAADFGKESSLPCIHHSTIDTMQSNVENITPSNCSIKNLSTTFPQKFSTVKVPDSINLGEDSSIAPIEEHSQHENIEESPHIHHEIDVQAETSTAIEQPNFLALAPYAPNRVALAHLLQVGGSISSGLIEVGSAVGSVLSEQAEKVIEKTSKIIPFYSETEMSSVQSKKNDLLKELSRQCVLLGQAEEREKDYTVRLLHDGYLRETLTKLESNLDSVVNENENLRSQLKSFRAGNAALVSENTSCESEKYSLVLANNELLEENTSLSVQVARLEERLIAAESHSGIIQQELEREMSRFDREEARWHQEMDRIAQEQHAMRTELEFAATNSVKQLEASEKKRDAAYAEMAIMRETFASKSDLAEKEFTKLKDCMAAQSDSYNQSLEEQQVAHSNTKAQLAIVEDENRQHVSDLALALTRINILMKENSQMQEKTDLLVKTSQIVDNEKMELLKKGEELRSSFEAEKKLLVNQIGSTRSRLAEMETENDRLYHENNLLREQLSSQKQQFQFAVDSLQERCTRIETDRDSMQREYVASLALVEMNADAAKELSEKLSSISNDKERLNAEVLELKLQRDVLNAEVAASRIEVKGVLVHDSLPLQGSASLEEAAL